MAYDNFSLYAQSVVMHQRGEFRIKAMFTTEHVNNIMAVVLCCFVRCAVRVASRGNILPGLPT
jgi:hypothetical protein